MSEHYILDENHNAVPADLMTWARSLENSEARRVAQTYIGIAMVSTVFLGLDHSFWEGPPLLFETMVFGGACDGDMERCTTWSEAEAQHSAMCDRVRAGETS